MEFLQKIKQIIFSIGITRQELRLIFFLLLFLFIGLALKIFKEQYPQYEKFDYTYVDSLFATYENRIDTTYNPFLMESDTIILKSLNVDRKININEASEKELALLPNIGPKTANTIIEHRIKFGEFKSIEDLMNVKGIGQKKFDKLKNNIIVENN